MDKLIKKMQNSGFLNDDNVESAFRNTPRDKFVPKSEFDKAYCDRPLQIMKNQTISQPSVVSRMIEWLDIKDGQNILEVGTGSGWQTGILSYLVKTRTIYSVEIHPELTKFAKENLDKLDIDNVHLISGDGSMGYPKASPYDRIVISASCTKIPSPLFEQLAENGLIVAPIGDSFQSLVLLKKTLGKIIEVQNQPNYVFVPLLGKFGKNK